MQRRAPHRDVLPVFFAVGIPLSNTLSYLGVKKGHVGLPGLCMNIVGIKREHVEIGPLNAGCHRNSDVA